jgi:ribosome-binding protein aMBF1 (putative translation factor)
MRKRMPAICSWRPITFSLTHVHAQAHAVCVPRSKRAVSRPRKKLDIQTEGRRLLAAYLEKNASQGALAERVGVFQSSVSLWLHGRARPEQAIRLRLEGIAGIPTDAWVTAEERQAADECRRPRRRTGTEGR